MMTRSATQTPTDMRMIVGIPAIMSGFPTIIRGGAHSTPGMCGTMIPTFTTHGTTISTVPGIPGGTIHRITGIREASIITAGTIPDTMCIISRMWSTIGREENRDSGGQVNEADFQPVWGRTAISPEITAPLSGKGPGRPGQHGRM